MSAHRLLGETDPKFALQGADEELGVFAFALGQQRLDQADLAHLTLFARVSEPN